MTTIQHTIAEAGMIEVNDVLTFLQKQADASIPLFLFSPPYNLGNIDGTWLPGAKHTGHYAIDLPLGRRGGKHGMGKKGGKWDGGALANGYDDYGDNMPWSEYIAWQKAILIECWRCLPEHGAIFYNHKPRTLAGVLLEPRDYVPTDLTIRQRIIWARAGGVNFNPGYYCPTHEEILIIAKPDFRLKSKGASGAGSVWYIPQEASTWHPAPFPLALAERVLETTMPALVCDPFSGSGTVARAAKRFGIDFIGCDRNAAYVERANQEIAKERKMTTRQKTMTDVLAEQQELFV